MGQFAEELLKEFLLDSKEQIEIIENTVVNLEKELSSHDIDLLFRTFHTLKGNSALVGQVKIRDLSHLVETMIGEIKNGNGKISEMMTNLILSSTDLVRVMIRELEGVNRQINTDTSVVIEKIKDFIVIQKESKKKPVNESSQVADKAKEQPKKMAVKSHPKLAIFELPDRLEISDMNDFIGIIRLFRQRGTPNYIFKFDNTTLLTEGGAEIIFTAIKEIEAGSGRLLSCNISSSVMETLKREDLENMMEIEPSIKDAALTLNLF